MIQPSNGGARRIVEHTVGRYTILETLGRGGMAEVFRARLQSEAGVSRDFALKRLRPEFAENPTFVTMFQNEARLAATLDHPNIVKIFEFGRDEDSYFLVMELVHGYRLRDVLRTLVVHARKMPLSLALYIARETLSGLDAAHRARAADGSLLQVVHRDISPENILLGRAGEVKICDFGIARALSSLPDVTVSTTFKGKYRYMSPEQAQGEALDGRSDLFSLGSVLWECLAGRLLFEQEGILEIIGAVRAAHVPSLAALRNDVPVEADDVLAKALWPDPDQRFQRASDMREAIDRVLGAIPAGEGTSEQERPTSSGLAYFLAEVLPEGGTGIRRHVAERFLAACGAEVEHPAPEISRLGKTLPMEGGNIPPAILNPLPETVSVRSGGFLSASRPPMAPSTTPRKRRIFLIGTICFLGLMLVGLVAAVRDGAMTTGPVTSSSAEAIARAQTRSLPVTSASGEVVVQPIMTRNQTDVRSSPRRAVSRKRAAREAKDPPSMAQAKVVAEQPGTLSLNVQPWADVRVDGELMGRTPILNLPLLPGRHKVELRNPPTNRSRTLFVEIRPGAAVQKFVRLGADASPP